MLKKSAFTLVELMIAMAIIGVLLGLAVFGVSAAQRAQRNTERKAALQDIKIGITQYSDLYSESPVNILFSASDSAAYIGITTGNCESNDKCVKVPLKAAGKPNGNYYDSTSVAQGSTNSRYLFSSQCDTGYKLALCSEGSNTAVELGTCEEPSGLQCTN